jgi:hypothetical protein
VARSTQRPTAKVEWTLHADQDADFIERLRAWLWRRLAIAGVGLGARASMEVRSPSLSKLSFWVAAPLVEKLPGLRYRYNHILAPTILSSSGCWLRVRPVRSAPQAHPGGAGETVVNLAASARVVSFSNVAGGDGGGGGDRAAGSPGGVGIDLLAKGTITSSGTGGQTCATESSI